MILRQFCLGNNLPTHIKENTDFLRHSQLPSTEANFEGCLVTEKKISKNIRSHEEVFLKVVPWSSYEFLKSEAAAFSYMLYKILVVINLVNFTRKYCVGVTFFKLVASCHSFVKRVSDTDDILWILRNF